MGPDAEATGAAQDSVVLVAQGVGNTRHQLLPGSLDLGAEVLAEVTGQDHDQHVTQTLVHVQLVAVQFAQLGKGALEVVEVLQGIAEGGQHLSTMGLDLGVAHHSAGGGQVTKGFEEPLGPGVVPAKGFATQLIDVHFPPQVGDGTLLTTTQMHHFVGFASSLEDADVQRLGCSVPTEPAFSRCGETCWV
uniref:Uncharacterized protein n=1 Tax=Ornithorhynchus anatinus TaxID=9258 RepID=F7AI41_ORNAN